MKTVISFLLLFFCILSTAQTNEGRDPETSANSIDIELIRNFTLDTPIKYLPLFDGTFHQLGLSPQTSIKEIPEVLIKNYKQASNRINDIAEYIGKEVNKKRYALIALLNIYIQAEKEKYLGEIKDYIENNNLNTEVYTFSNLSEAKNLVTVINLEIYRSRPINLDDLICVPSDYDNCFTSELTLLESKKNEISHILLDYVNLHTKENECNLNDLLQCIASNNKAFSDIDLSRHSKVISHYLFGISLEKSTNDIFLDYLIEYFACGDCKAQKNLLIQAKNQFDEYKEFGEKFRFELKPNEIEIVDSIENENTGVSLVRGATGSVEFKIKKDTFSHWTKIKYPNLNELLKILSTEQLGNLVSICGIQQVDPKRLLIETDHIAKELFNCIKSKISKQSEAFKNLSFGSVQLKAITLDGVKKLEIESSELPFLGFVISFQGDNIIFKMTDLLCPEESQDCNSEITNIITTNTSDELINWASNYLNNTNLIIHQLQFKRVCTDGNCSIEIISINNNCSLLTVDNEGNTLNDNECAKKWVEGLVGYQLPGSLTKALISNNLTWNHEGPSIGFTLSTNQDLNITGKVVLAPEFKVEVDDFSENVKEYIEQHAQDEANKWFNQMLTDRNDFSTSIGGLNVIKKCDNTGCDLKVETVDESCVFFQADNKNESHEFNGSHNSDCAMDWLLSFLTDTQLNAISAVISLYADGLNFALELTDGNKLKGQIQFQPEFGINFDSFDVPVKQVAQSLFQEWLSEIKDDKFQFGGLYFKKSNCNEGSCKLDVLPTSKKCSLLTIDIEGNTSNDQECIKEWLEGLVGYQIPKSLTDAISRYQLKWNKDEPSIGFTLSTSQDLNITGKVVLAPEFKVELNNDIADLAEYQICSKVIKHLPQIIKVQINGVSYDCTDRNPQNLELSIAGQINLSPVKLDRGKFDFSRVNIQTTDQLTNNIPNLLNNYFNFPGVKYTILNNEIKIGEQGISVPVQVEVEALEKVFRTDDFPIRIDITLNEKGIDTDIQNIKNQLINQLIFFLNEDADLMPFDINLFGQDVIILAPEFVDSKLKMELATKSEESQVSSIIGYISWEPEKGVKINSNINLCDQMLSGVLNSAIPDNWSFLTLDTSAAYCKNDTARVPVLIDLLSNSFNIGELIVDNEGRTSFDFQSDIPLPPFVVPPGITFDHNKIIPPGDDKIIKLKSTISFAKLEDILKIKGEVIVEPEKDLAKITGKARLFKIIDVSELNGIIQHKDSESTKKGLAINVKSSNYELNKIYKFEACFFTKGTKCVDSSGRVAEIINMEECKNIQNRKADLFGCGTLELFGGMFQRQDAFFTVNEDKIYAEFSYEILDHSLFLGVETDPLFVNPALTGKLKPKILGEKVSIDFYITRTSARLKVKVLGISFGFVVPDITDHGKWKKIIEDRIKDLLKFDLEDIEAIANAILNGNLEINPASGFGDGGEGSGGNNTGTGDTGTGDTGTGNTGTGNTGTGNTATGVKGTQNSNVNQGDQQKTYDRNGFDGKGFYSDGYDEEGYNEFGFNRSGTNSKGVDVIGKKPDQEISNEIGMFLPKGNSAFSYYQDKDTNLCFIKEHNNQNGFDTYYLISKDGCVDYKESHIPIRFGFLRSGGYINLILLNRKNAEFIKLKTCSSPIPPMRFSEIYEKLKGDFNNCKVEILNEFKASKLGVNPSILSGGFKAIPEHSKNIFTEWLRNDVCDIFTSNNESVVYGSEASLVLSVSFSMQGLVKNGGCENLSNDQFLTLIKKVKTFNIQHSNAYFLYLPKTKEIMFNYIDSTTQEAILLSSKDIEIHFNSDFSYNDCSSQDRTSIYIQGRVEWLGSNVNSWINKFTHQSFDLIYEFLNDINLRNLQVLNISRKGIFVKEPESDGSNDKFALSLICTIPTTKEKKLFTTNFLSREDLMIQFKKLKPGSDIEDFSKLEKYFNTYINDENYEKCLAQNPCNILTSGIK